MIRSVSISLAAALIGIGALGCNKAVDEQKKADEARSDADKKVGEASNEAAEKINAARAEADKKVAEAQANFLKMREDYRHKVTQDLVSVDKDIADLDAKTKTATGKTKAQIEAALPGIRSLRENVSSEYRSLEFSSALSWDSAQARAGVKGRRERRLSDYRKER
jgi:hypothetical protein